MNIFVKLLLVFKILIFVDLLWKDIVFLVRLRVIWCFFFKKLSLVIKEWGNLFIIWIGRENVLFLNELVFLICLVFLCDFLYDL